MQAQITEDFEIVSQEFVETHSQRSDGSPIQYMVRVDKGYYIVVWDRFLRVYEISCPGFHGIAIKKDRISTIWKLPN